MARRVPAKSILKSQPASKAERSEAEIQTEKDRRNLDIALQHAHLIQHQKDVQAKILSAIELLLDYPSTPKFTDEDAVKYVILVQPFQPSDLDALVEERRIAGKCGYALCSNAPRVATLGDNATWKLAKSGGDYCSNVCMRKSLYIKTQLSEIPAWERDPTYQVRIVLHEDDRPTEVPNRKKVTKWLHHLPDNSQDLAAERGESRTSLKPKQVMADHVIEKPVNYKPLSSVDKATYSHTAIEGHEPRHVAKDSALDKTTHEGKEVTNDDDDSSDGNDYGLWDDIDERGVGGRWRKPDGTWGETWIGKEDSDD